MIMCTSKQPQASRHITITDCNHEGQTILCQKKHARLFAIYIYGMKTYSLEMSNSVAQQNEFLKLIELLLCLFEYLYQPHFLISDCEPLDENTFQCRANVKIGNWKTMFN